MMRDDFFFFPARVFKEDIFEYTPFPRLPFLTMPQFQAELKAISEDPERSVKLARAVLEKDSVLSSVARLTKESGEYQSTIDFINGTELTFLSKLVLVPSLLLNATLLSGKRPRHTIQDVAHHQQLIELIKLCIVKGADMHAHSIARAMMLSYGSIVFLKHCSVDLSGVFGSSGLTVFHCASIAPWMHYGLREKLLACIFSLGTLINIQDNGTWKNTPWHNTIANESASVTGLMLEEAIKRNLEADLTIKDSEGKTPLLLAAKFNVDMALHVARRAHRKRPDLVKVNFRQADELGRTGLHYGCFFKNPETIWVFLAEGCDINQADSYGKTPLDYLVLRKASVIRKALLDAEIDPDRPRDAYLNDQERPQDIPYQTLLEHRLSDGQFNACVRVILRHCPDASSEKLGLLFRNIALRSQDLSVFLASLLGRVDLNGSGTSGNTALHVASYAGNCKHVAWLLGHGAIQLKNRKGKIAAELAKGEAKNLFQQLSAGAAEVIPEQASNQ